MTVTEVTDEETSPSRDGREDDQRDHAWHKTQCHEGEWNAQNTKTELRLGDQESSTKPVEERSQIQQTLERSSHKEDGRE